MLLDGNAQPTTNVEIGTMCRVCDVCIKTCTDNEKPGSLKVQQNGSLSAVPTGLIPQASLDTNHQSNSDLTSIPTQSAAVSMQPPLPPLGQSLLSSSVVPSDWTWSTF
jgi:hypothetical protein